MSGSIGIVSAKVRKKRCDPRRRQTHLVAHQERKREEGRRLKSLKKPKFPIDIHPWVYTNAPQRT
ncbi:MAG: hypothetical protein F6K24_18535 [Okeania sp. SIO2D1]|nr:hypothetical protein [Okeania sp. SIO2D1]